MPDGADEKPTANFEAGQHHAFKLDANTEAELKAKAEFTAQNLHLLPEYRADLFELGLLEPTADAVLARVIRETDLGNAEGSRILRPGQGDSQKDAVVYEVIKAGPRVEDERLHEPGCQFLSVACAADVAEDKKGGLFCYVPEMFIRGVMSVAVKQRRLEAVRDLIDTEKIAAENARRENKGLPPISSVDEIED